MGLLAVGLLVAGGCGDDGDSGAAPSDEADAGDGGSEAAGGEVVVAEPDDSLTGWGHEARIGQPIDFDGVVVTVNGMAPGEGEPLVPTAHGVVEADVEVENTGADEAVVPTLSILCEALEAGAGAAHGADLLVDPVPADGQVGGTVTLDVPGACDGPALVITRLSGTAGEGSPIAHVLVPEDALP